MRNYDHAGEVLRVWLDAQGINAAELSRRTDIDAGTLRNILCGRKRSISTRNMMILAHYFGMSMQELMDQFSRGVAENA